MLGIALSLLSPLRFQGGIQLFCICAIAVVILSSIEASARLQRNAIMRLRAIQEQVSTLRQTSVELKDAGKANELRIRQLGQLLIKTQSSMDKLNADQIKNELRLRQIGQISLGISKTLTEDMSEPAVRVVSESRSVMNDDVAAISSAYLKNQILLDLSSIKYTLQARSSVYSAQLYPTESNQIIGRNGDND